MNVLAHIIENVWCGTIGTVWPRTRELSCTWSFYPAMSAFCCSGSFLGSPLHAQLLPFLSPGAKLEGVGQSLFFWSNIWKMVCSYSVALVDFSVHPWTTTENLRDYTTTTTLSEVETLRGKKWKVPGRGRRWVASLLREQLPTSMTTKAYLCSPLIMKLGTSCLEEPPRNKAILAVFHGLWSWRSPTLEKPHLYLNHPLLALSAHSASPGSSILVWLRKVSSH